MRRQAWMLVLLTGAFIGCGGNPSNKGTVSTSAAKEAAVPPEVAGLFERGELSQAVDALSTLISQAPRDENLLALRATAYHRLRRNDEALADLEKAISMNDRDARLYNNRGFIYLGMEQFELALQDFDKATGIAPDYVNVFNNRGLLYIAQKKYADAIAQFNRALQIDNRYVDAYNNRGFAECEAGQIEEALDDFNLAIQLNPDYINAYNNRGLLRARAGDFENAVIDFTRAMMLDPLNPKYYEHRCEIYERQGFVDKAIDDDKKITWLIEYHRLTAKIASAKSPVDELTKRASHYLQRGDTEKALVDLDRALTLDGRSATALVIRAGIRLQQKEFDEAKSDAQASLAIESSQEAYSVLGDVYLNHNDYDRAIENYAHARRVDANVAEAYYAKSKALEKQGLNDLAKDNLAQALVLDPNVENRLR